MREKKNRGSQQPSKKIIVGGRTTLSPAGLRSALQQGIGLLQSGRLQDAERLFQSVLTIDSKNVNALQLLGLIQFQTGRYKDGEQLLRLAIKQKPNIADLHYNLGNMLEQQGKLDQALVSYKNALKLGLDNDQIRNNLGMLLSKMGRLEEAEASLRKAIDINPQNPSALSNYGLVLRKLNRLDEATKAVEQAISIEPHFVDAISNLGSICFEKNELEEAEEYLRQALKLDTKNANVMNNLAGVLLRKNKNDEALVFIRMALEISPQSTDAMLNLARLLADKDDAEEAIDVYRNILDITPEHTDALAGLGFMLSTQGRFDEAAACFQDILKVDPNKVAARTGLIDINLPDIHDAEIMDLERLYTDAEVSDEDKIKIAFCLAKVFEKGGEYKKSFGYLADGNRLKRKSYQYLQENDRLCFGEIKAAFSQQFFQQYADAGFRDKTPIFILGMPRSGTTLTEQILSNHPQVFGAGELPDMRRLIEKYDIDGGNGFTERVEQLGADDFAQMGMDYIAGLKARGGSAYRITDKMPHNFLYVGMIRLMLPNAKIIHCQRDPVDNCLSIFKQNFAGLHKYAYDQRELGGYHLLYQDLMAHWRKALPGFMFELQYEDMVADQEGMTRKLLEYCELPWDDNCLQFHKSERTVKTASYTQVRKKIYTDSVELWRRYEEELQPLINALDGK